MLGPLIAGEDVSTARNGMPTEKRYVTLILRLVLDAHGRVDHGEVVDADATLLGRFSGKEGLLSTVRAWLTGQEQSQGSQPLP
jgi:hypothetical protein